MIEKDLQTFGLTEKEAAVYVAALKLGPTTALQLAKATAIKRPTVYTVIEDLKRKGLMGVELKGLKQLFVAAHPDQFDAIVESQRKRFDTLLPELLALHKLRGNQNALKYYEGIEGLKSVYETILREARSTEPYYVITKQEHWVALDPKWFEDFVERRSRKNLDTRILFQKSERALFNKERARALNQKVKVLQSESQFTSDIIITPERYVVHSFAPVITTIVIENADIVQTQLEIFRNLWEATE